MAKRLTPQERIERTTLSKYRGQMAILAALTTKHQRGHLTTDAYQRALDREARRCLRRALEVPWNEALVKHYQEEGDRLSRQADDLTGRPHSRLNADTMPLGEGES